MKIKLSKTIAVVLAICVMFASFSAFAASVKMTTTYDYDGDNSSVNVTTTVDNIAEGAEVTYYVSNANEIVYINQLTAEDGDVTFPTFSAAWNTLLTSNVIVGSDADYNNASDALTFVEGGNAKTPGNAHAEAAEGAVWEEVTGEEAGLYLDEDDEEGTKAFAYTATVSGNYSEYGLTVTMDEGTRNLKAYGCDADGTYVIVVKGKDLTAADFTATVPYAN